MSCHNIILFTACHFASCVLPCRKAIHAPTMLSCWDGSSLRSSCPLSSSDPCILRHHTKQMKVWGYCHPADSVSVFRRRLQPLIAGFMHTFWVVQVAFRQKHRDHHYGEKRGSRSCFNSERIGDVSKVLYLITKLAARNVKLNLT